MSHIDAGNDRDRGLSPTYRAALFELKSSVANLVASCNAWMDRMNDDVRTRGEMTELEWFCTCQVSRVKQVLSMIEGFLDWVERDHHGAAKVTDISVAPSIYDDFRKLADRLEREQRRSVVGGQPQEAFGVTPPPLGAALQCAQSAVEVAMGFLRQCRPGVLHEGDPDDDWLAW